MELQTDDHGGIVLRLDAHEVKLMRLTLKRATFEDTPASTLEEVLEFAMRLLAQVGDD